MGWIKTCAWLAVFMCVSAPAGSVDPTCISNFLKGFKPSANQLGFQFSEVQILFPDIDLSNLSPFEDLDFFNDAMLTRHHIVPRSLLRDFFIQALSDNDFRPRFVALLRNAIEIARGHNPDAVVEYTSDMLDMLGSMSPENVAQFREPVRGAFKVFCWMPFNFFEGPNHLFRSDDPGGAMEAGASVVVDNQNTFANMVELNSFMTDFTVNHGDRVR